MKPEFVILMTNNVAPCEVRFTALGDLPVTQWAFGDGHVWMPETPEEKKQMSVMHTYTSSGTYRATLVVGLLESDARVITVLDKPEPVLTWWQSFVKWLKSLVGWT